MFTNTFWFKAIQTYLARKVEAQEGRDSKINYKDKKDCFSVYEQQRWWLGKWSDKLLGKESVPWLDARSGIFQNTPRDTYTLPQQNGYKWVGPWQVDTGPMTDNDGWQYARDFGQKFWTPRKDIRDFVRRRKWCRQYTRTD